jgi:hypothetical protein
LRVFSEVISFFRNRNGCEHFLLAIDELLHLDLSSEGIKSARIQGAIKAIANTVVPTDGIHTIISSLVTNPFEEYIRGSQYTPYFVRLPPLLENLDHLSKLLAKNVMIRAPNYLFGNYYYQPEDIRS